MSESRRTFGARLRREYCATAPFAFLILLAIEWYKGELDALSAVVVAGASTVVALLVVVTAQWFIDWAFRGRAER